MQSMESAAVADKKISPFGKGLAMEPAAAGDEKSKQQRRKNFSSPRRRSTMDQKQLASSFGCFICKGPHLQRVCPCIGQGKKIVCWRCGASDHLISRCTKPRKKKPGCGGKFNVASAKASRAHGTGGPRGVGNRGHLASSTRKVSQVKANQGRGPGRGTAARSITSGGGTAQGVTAPVCTVQHGSSRGECSLDGGRPLQDSRSGRGAQAGGAAPAPRGAPGASAQGEQGCQPAVRSKGPSTAVTERRRWARPPASAEPPGRQ
mmetsp:Transcript_52336/g.76481  ORF Transcript_52336/g.76481 Transcript_52336/m.76481 type:complete len:262 (-) Transcript_52336:12-797(-)